MIYVFLCIMMGKLHVIIVELCQRNHLEAISLVITFFSAIGTIIAAIFTAKSANSAKKAAQASRESVVLQRQQMEQQNKLELLQERRETLILCESLIEAFEETKQFLPKSKSEEAGDILSQNMCKMLMLSLEKNIIEENYNDGSIYHAATFSSGITRKAKEIKYIFPNKTHTDRMNTVSQFLEIYAKLVTLLIKHNVVCDDCYKSVSQENISFATKVYNEIVETVLKLGEIIDKLKKEKTLDWMEKETKISKEKE